MPLAGPIEVGELERRLAQGLLAIDTRPEEWFASAHLPGARNACVAKVSFLEDVAALGIGLDRPVAVYGTSARSRASALAAERLAAAGYREVHDFRGGLEAWRAAGKPVEGTGAPPPGWSAELPRAGRYRLDAAKSVIGWMGRSHSSRHSGTLRLAPGEIEVREGGAAMAGALEVDLRSLECSDLTDPALNKVLIDHLRSDDFFAVDRFPLARFAVTRVAALEGASLGSENATVEGTLRLRGVEAPVSLRCTVTRRPEGRLCVEAHAELDRVRWGADYGSGKVYEELGMHLVYDDVAVDLLVFLDPCG